MMPVAITGETVGHSLRCCVVKTLTVTDTDRWPGIKQFSLAYCIKLASLQQAFSSIVNHKIFGIKNFFSKRRIFANQYVSLDNFHHPFWMPGRMPALK